MSPARRPDQEVLPSTGAARGSERTRTAVSGAARGSERTGSAVSSAARGSERTRTAVSGAARETVRASASSGLQRYDDTEILRPLFTYVREHLPHLSRFALVGASLAMLNLAFLYCLRIWLGLPDPIAVTGMYILGVLAHFPSHRWITYGAQRRAVGPQLRRYAVMLVWNFAIMQAVVGLAGRASISPYIAVMIATGLTMVSNFIIMTHIVFARRHR